MNRLWIGAMAVAVASAVACGTAAAQVAKYVDAQGVTHYVGSEAQIPEQYRGHAAPAGLPTSHEDPNSDVRQDRRDVRQDTRDIRQDRRDVVRDTRGLREDRRETGQDATLSGTGGTSPEIDATSPRNAPSSNRI